MQDKNLGRSCMFLSDGFNREQPFWALVLPGMQKCGAWLPDLGRVNGAVGSKTEICCMQHAWESLRKAICVWCFLLQAPKAWELCQSPFQRLYVVSRETISFWPASMCLLDGRVSSGLQWILAVGVLGAGLYLQHLEMQQLELLLMSYYWFRVIRLGRQLYVFFSFCWQPFRVFCCAHFVVLGISLAWVTIRRLF